MDGNVGEIRLFAGSTPPQGWKICNGETLSISSYQSLFFAINTIFGGDGEKKFNLPDFSGRTAVGTGTSASGKKVKLGEQGGTANFKLTAETMPSHMHTVGSVSAEATTTGFPASVKMQGNSNLGTAASPVEGYPAAPSDYGGAYANSEGKSLSSFSATKSGELTLKGTVSLEDTGTQKPISNYQPALGLNYIICYEDVLAESSIIGCIQMNGNQFQTAPQNALLCDGTKYSANDYKSLYSVIGGIFNATGTGQNSFNVPNLQGLSVANQGTSYELDTEFFFAANVGALTVTISEDNLPAHTHAFKSTISLQNSLSFKALPPVSATSGTATDPASNIVAQASSGTKRFAATTDSEMDPSTVQFSGSAKVSGSVTCAETGGTGSTVDLHSPYLGIYMQLTTQGVYLPSPGDGGSGSYTAYIGEIRLFTGNYTPQGWLDCDGSTISVESYNALASLLGNTYGTPPNANLLVLPDLKCRIPVGIGQADANAPKIALGQKFGTVKTSLTPDNLPAHTHALTPTLTLKDTIAATVQEPGNSETANVSTPSNNCFATLTGGDKGYSAPNQSTGLGAGPVIDISGVEFSLDATATVSTTGQGKSFDNIMPGMALRYVICASGVYPSANDESVTTGK